MVVEILCPLMAKGKREKEPERLVFTVLVKVA